ncbi:hypothetical protein Slala03_54810 [Streptomyces lavendulae subsp. lavendulae]|nr:hypothetical protein Slala03_54810 [Streptomyces lavendulae subsp. lavendulae]GLW02755.1 hypothetical protein Slala05_63850 [Streptomyces lavendulae subsp. lavendulae]
MRLPRVFGADLPGAALARGRAAKVLTQVGGAETGSVRRGPEGVGTRSRARLKPALMRAGRA